MFPLPISIYLSWCDGYNKGIIALYFPSLAEQYWLQSSRHVQVTKSQRSILPRSGFWQRQETGSTVKSSSSCWENPLMKSRFLDIMIHLKIMSQEISRAQSLKALKKNLPLKREIWMSSTMPLEEVVDWCQLKKVILKLSKSSWPSWCQQNWKNKDNN